MGFNPLPSPKQGETFEGIKARFLELVSIRSPHRSKGRPRSWCVSRCASRGFNPLPSPKQGETITPQGHRASPRRFNPLPSPKQGETSSQDHPCLFPIRSFNPLPSPKQGETECVCASLPSTTSVSIRSPHRSKGETIEVARMGEGFPVFQSAPLTEARGDRILSMVVSMSRKFQSAPLTEARGDVPRNSTTPRILGFNPLPSPKQGETRPVWRRRISLGSFNPLPSPKQGETSRGDLYPPLCNVSIRSPHRSKGRPAYSATQSNKELFQSAPLTEARGDFGALAVPARTASPCFNPLPSPKQGETRCRACRRTPRCVFQSAPLTEARGDRYSSAHTRGCWRFNPLPSPKQGETYLVQRDAADQRRFNPLPSPKQGETGRLPDRRGRLCRFNPLPSPKQGETSSKGRRGVVELVSIRSPHRSKGRQISDRLVLPFSRVSIRSPHRSKGRLLSMDDSTAIASLVSIRSPHRSKGRLFGASIAGISV